jgi:hypothetical protein
MPKRLRHTLFLINSLLLNSYDQECEEVRKKKIANKLSSVRSSKLRKLPSKANCYDPFPKRNAYIEDSKQSALHQNIQHMPLVQLSTNE